MHAEWDQPGPNAFQDDQPIGGVRASPLARPGSATGCVAPFHVFERNKSNMVNYQVIR